MQEMAVSVHGVGLVTLHDWKEKYSSRAHESILYSTGQYSYCSAIRRGDFLFVFLPYCSQRRLWRCMQGGITLHNLLLGSNGTLTSSGSAPYQAVTSRDSIAFLCHR